MRTAMAISCPPGRAGRWILSISGSLLLAAAFTLATAGRAEAQLGFTEFALTDTALNSSPGTDFWIATAAPADVDADGDLDLLVAGYFVVYPDTASDGSVEERLTLYRNDGPSGSEWVFTAVPVDAGTLSFGAADLAWGDYDNDGDPDAVVGADGAMALYRNDGGQLIPTGTTLPAYWEDNGFTTMDLHSISWADFDNDGDLDLLVPSVADGWDYGPTALLRNDGPGSGNAWIFSDTGAGLPVASNAVSAWADMEGDGDLDLLLGNISPYGDNFLNTYVNDAGTFTAADTGLAYVRYGTADWGDADNDGDLDIVYAGNIDRPDGFGETVVRLLRNDGPAGYTPVDIVHDFQSPDEPWLDFSAVTWADYDSDGDVDILISGEWLGPEDIEGRAEVYANNGGTFTLASEPLPAPIVGNAGGAFTWFDVDSDGDLDYFVAGGYYVPNGNGLIEARTQLFRNDAPSTNAPPTAPGNLQASGGGGTVNLSWSRSTDTRTPQAALTYQLEVYPLGSASPIERVLPEPGNVSRNATWTLQGLDPGSYGWRVRALDTAYNGSAAAQGAFTLGTSGTPEPSTPKIPGLSAVRPNPLRDAARFTITVEGEQPVRVVLFDVAGRAVAVLHDGLLGIGEHEFTIEGRKLASGTYFLRAETGGTSAVRRVTVVK